MKNNIKKKTIEILCTSTVHGVPNIANNSHIVVKFMWSFFLLISTGTCVYFIYDNVMNFMDNEYITNIDLIKEYNFQFPTVSFCVQSKDTDLSKILFYCLFDSKECKIKDFEVYNGLDETCYRFNSLKPIKYTLSSDFKTGLILILYLEKSFEGFFRSSLFINNHSDVFRRNRPYTFDSGILLPNGGNYVKIEREIVSKLPPPFNSCVKQDTDQFVSYLFQFFIQNNKTYSQKDCYDFCVEDQIKSECKCSAEIRNISKCVDNKNTLDCVLKLAEKYIKKELSLPEICLSSCPMECDYIRYRTFHTFGGLPSNDYLTSIFGNLTIEQMESFKMNGVFLSVFYTDGSYTYISQIVKSRLVDLISNLGGLVGVFIGASFLSFFEIVEILIEIYFILKSKTSSF